MRLFCESDLLAKLEACDFDEVRIYDDEHLGSGITWQDRTSLPVMARVAAG
jgi:hypothetical protein